MTRHLPSLALRLCRGGAGVVAAQRLRYAAFVEEAGGQGGALTDPARGIEADRFDAHALHVLVVDALRDGAVVATARVMDGAGAARAGGFAAEDEFDLRPLRQSGRRLLEVGRTCVHPDHRGGLALPRLWQGLAGVAAARGAQLLFGLASVPVEAAGSGALVLLMRDHLAPAHLRPRSREPAALGAAGDRRAAMLAVPPLVKAYLRMGAWVGEGAYRDPAFGCVDLCMVLDGGGLPARARAMLGPDAPGRGAP